MYGVFFPWLFFITLVQIILAGSGFLSSGAVLRHSGVTSVFC
jgi:hypothetical protein